MTDESETSEEEPAGPGDPTRGDRVGDGPSDGATDAGPADATDPADEAGGDAGSDPGAAVPAADEAAADEAAADEAAADEAAADEAAADEAAADEAAADEADVTDGSEDRSSHSSRSPGEPTAGSASGDSPPGSGMTGVGDGTDDTDTAGSDQAGIDASEIDPAKLTVPERSLDSRIRIIWVLRAVLVALVVGGLGWAGSVYVFEVGLVLPVGLATVFLVLGVAHALLRYRVWRYEVREDALYLERGVLTRVRTVVPFVRIQHVDTSRGPVERATGLATSVVYTAGSRGADVTIPGLEADRAEDLQRRLKRLAIASEADTAV